MIYSADEQRAIDWWLNQRRLKKRAKMKILNINWRDPVDCLIVAAAVLLVAGVVTAIVT